MKRVLILLALVFSCGLGVSAAIIGEGRMAHLRRFVPQILPQWSRAVADDATILRGQSNNLDGPLTTTTPAQAH